MIRLNSETLSKVVQFFSAFPMFVCVRMIEGCFPNAAFLATSLLELVLLLGWCTCLANLVHFDFAIRQLCAGDSISSILSFFVIIVLRCIQFAFCTQHTSQVRNNKTPLTDAWLLPCRSRIVSQRRFCFLTPGADLASGSAFERL